MKTSVKFILTERWILFPLLILVLIGFLGISIDVQKQSKDSNFRVYPAKEKDDPILHPYLLQRDILTFASPKFYRNTIRKRYRV